ncbi:MAG: alpha/beta fold hydrolase [Planctomycetota bacterium]|jgi:pimeloyl-ACP methyl ester carboxylesterase
MILFAHGLEGSPQGTKIRSLREAGFEIEAPDFTGQRLAERIAGLERATRGRKIILGGSSYGGLAAAYLAALHPDRFTGLLLCAPALNLREPPVNEPDSLSAPPTIPTIIIHGVMDDVVPIDGSRRYRDRSGPHVKLWEVEDGHRLSGSLESIHSAARELVEK